MLSRLNRLALRRFSSEAAAPAAPAAPVASPRGTVPYNVRFPKPPFVNVLPVFNGVHLDDDDKNFKLARPVTKTSTLSNKMRVVTQDTGGMMSSFGVFINAGPVYETQENQGITHVLEHLAFKSTVDRSTFKLVRTMEESGYNVVSSRQRDHMEYAVSCIRENRFHQHAFYMLFESTMLPQLNEWEVQAACAQAVDDVDNANIDNILSEFLHKTMFSGSPLANPAFISKDNVSKFTPSVVGEFIRDRFRPSHMVLTGVNVDHDKLVEMAEITFGQVMEPETPLSELPANVYTGGDLRMFDKDADATRILLGFEGCSWHSKDLAAVCILSSLLGGGSSFSAGGPGKGMHSRLYRDVLNKYDWAHGAHVVTQFYKDTGIFALYGLTNSSNAPKMTETLAKQIRQLLDGKLTEQELSRARNLLKSGMYSAIESTAALTEDLGRGLMAFDRYIPPSEMSENIDSVKVADIQRVVQQMISKPFTLVTHGDTTRLPDSSKIASLLRK